MPQCSTQKNKDGVEILFEEESHRYTSVLNGETVEYVSGTTFVNSFFPKFDPDGKIAKRKALSEGITEEEIRKRWENSGKEASAFGTKIHETMEDVLSGNFLRNKPENDKEKATMSAAVKLAKKILEKCDIVGIERIVFDTGILIAGTIDLLARSKKDGTLWIFDHKTNKKIEIENRWRKFGLEPITNVPDTNFFHYSLQLNLYENIMRRAGYVDEREKIKKGILHITQDGNKTYGIGDFQDEIKKMVSSFKR